MKCFCHHISHVKSDIEDGQVILVISEKSSCLPSKFSVDYHWWDFLSTEFYCGISFRILLDYPYWTGCFGLFKLFWWVDLLFWGFCLLSAYLPYCLFLFVQSCLCFHSCVCLCVPLPVLTSNHRESAVILWCKVYCQRHIWSKIIFYQALGILIQRIII